MALDDLPLADRIEFERFSTGLVRRRLGLEHELTLQEERIADEAETSLSQTATRGRGRLRT